MKFVLPILSILFFSATYATIEQKLRQLTPPSPKVETIHPRAIAAAPKPLKTQAANIQSMAHLIGFSAFEKLTVNYQNIKHVLPNLEEQSKYLIAAFITGALGWGAIYSAYCSL